MGAKASELKSCVVWLAIDKDKIGPNVAIPETRPLSTEGMITMAGQ